MSYLPDPLEEYNGETVLYATGYQIDRNFIKQHYMIGLLFCLTIVGAVIGIPVILRGFYLNQRAKKAIIVTELRIYELAQAKVLWSTELTNIGKIEGRRSKFGFLDIRFTTENGPNRVVTGNFYDNEIRILFHIIFSNKEKLKRSGDRSRE